MTISKEASLFVNQNENTKKLTPFDTYRANQFISGEDETELSQLDKRIANVCAEYGVIVEKVKGGRALKSVTEARKIMKRDGEQGLEFVFEVVKESHWDEFSKGYSGDLMCSLGKIYCNYPNELNVMKNRLCGFLINSTPDELDALGNNTYPNLKRRARLDAILADIIREPESTKPKKGNPKGKVTKIA